MNKLFAISFTCLIIAIATLSSCKKTTPVSDSTKKKFADMEGVLGKWQRENPAKETVTIENWEKKGEYLLSGTGITTKNGEEVFKEKLSILVKDDVIYYVADVPENKKPIYFKVTETGPDHFVSENPEHDYPKKIVYTWYENGKKLKAQTFGDGKRVDFTFYKPD